MQNAAFAARGLDWAYLPLLVEEGQVEDAIRGLVALGFAGANVTEIRSHLTWSTPSVNTTLPGATSESIETQTSHHSGDATAAPAFYEAQALRGASARIVGSDGCHG